MLGRWLLVLAVLFLPLESGVEAKEVHGKSASAAAKSHPSHGGATTRSHGVIVHNRGAGGSHKRLHHGTPHGKRHLVGHHPHGARSAALTTSPRSGGSLHVSAGKAMVVDQETGTALFSRNSDQPSPIASVTKLMTAMVVLDRNLPMEESITIIDDDVDHLKYSSSRLAVGTVFTRREALQLALMSSENRAAASLARTYPGGSSAFVVAMNHKARELGMSNSHFADSTGLNSANVSTAEDLVKMVRAAYRYDLIRDITTSTEYELGVGRARRSTLFHNTNRLVSSDSWHIGLSKTGYINEAGRCLVMQARIKDKPTIMVFLDNWGKYSCAGDATRVRQWLER